MTKSASDKLEHDGKATIKSISDRLERLPVSRFHWYVVLVCGFGQLVDAIDVGMVSSIMASLRKSWNLAPEQIGLIGSAGFIGMFIGALLIGPIADRFGRKKVFLTTALWIVIFTFLNGRAWDLDSFLVFRFLTGMGLGAEVPLMVSYFSEMVPSKSRGKLISIYGSFFSIGLLIASALGLVLVPKFGWPIMFLVAAIPGLALFATRLPLYESPRWMVSKNKLKEADEVTMKIENKVSVQLLKQQKQISEVANVQELFKGNEKVPLLEIWSKRFIGKMLLIAFAYFASYYATYGWLLWLPTLWVNSGLTLTQSLFYNVLLTFFQIPGFYLATPLIDRIGRKRLLSIALLVSAVAILCFGFINAFLLKIIFGALFSMSGSMTIVAVLTYSPELFPTRVRATAVGVASSAGRLGGIVAPMVTGLILGQTGSMSLVYIIMTLLLIIALILISAFAKETMGEKLQDN